MSKSKWFRLLSMVIISSTLIIMITGCGSPEENTTTSESQEATVFRGDLTVDITAAGNLALSQTEDIVADLFYQQGTIAEVNVESGDSVTEGQVLVNIDSDEWQEELDVLEDTLAAAERNLNTQERALATAERLVTTRELAVTAAKRQVSSREIAYQTAEINLEAAEYALATIQEVKEVQDDIDNAEYQLQYIKAKIDIIEPDADPLNYQFWSNEKVKVETKLAELQQEINKILAGTSINISDTTALEIQRKQLAIETARLNLESASDEVIQANLSVIEAESNLEDAILDLEYTRADIEDAKQNIESVSKSLEEAREKSPEITAPFDGFIISVNVEGGDEIIKGTVLVRIADPNKFEANILVSEMDIIQLELGGQAMVEVDSLQGITLPAEVTRIAPTATIQSGVVNYSVKVEISSMEAIREQAQDRFGQIAEQFAAGEILERLQQAIDEGRISEEQVKEMMERMESGDFTPPENFTPPEGFSPPEGMEFPAFNMDTSDSQSQGQLPTMSIPENFQLREGLTVTVTIIVDERTDVLLVPNAAVTTRGTQSYVEVVTASGETEQRTVQTGISDWQFTEITDGLSEGEIILVPQGTVTTIETQQRPGGMMFFGGPR
jgi:multidrug efflux pump subunit AcrA (membrane-fusion protein)